MRPRGGRGPRGPSLERRLAAGTGVLVALGALAGLAYAFVSARMFYFELRDDALEATGRAVEAVLRAAPLPLEDEPAAALGDLIAGLRFEDAVVGVSVARVAVENGPVLLDDLAAGDLDRIERTLGPVSADGAARGEVRLAAGDHEVLRRRLVLGGRTVDLVVADPDADVIRRRRRETVVAATVVAAVVVVGLAATWRVVRFGLRPLHAAARALDGIADEPPPTSPIPADAGPVELRPLLDALDRLLARLEASFARERRFAADAAHDLRTPIAGLRSTLELALARPRSADGDARTLADAMSATRRLERLAEDLLAIARRSSGRPDPPGDLVADAAAVVRAVAAAESALPDRRGTTISIDAPDPSAGPILAALPPSDLERIVRNLLANAILHGPGGRIELAVAARAERVRIEVRDEGTTLEPGDESVFERFVAGDASDGSGLGLAIARELARGAGGDVAVVAAVAPLATAFRVDLPRAPTGAPSGTGAHEIA